MNVIENYDILVREAALALQEPDLTNEEKAARGKIFWDLSKARNEALAAEHDYNNPTREFWDRFMTGFKIVMESLSPVAAYGIVCWMSTVLEMGSYIQPNTVKDALRKCKPDKR